MAASQLEAARATARAWKSEITKERRDFASRLEAVQSDHTAELRRRDAVTAANYKRRLTWAQKRAHVALELHRVRARLAR